MRATTASIVAIATVVALAGCSLLYPELARDDNGRVLEPAVIGSTQLLEGDCFTFVDGSNLSEAGSLQNAVSSACSATFVAFKETVAEGARPDQEFIISERTTDDGVLMTDYACIATDEPVPEA